MGFPPQAMVGQVEGCQPQGGVGLVVVEKAGTVARWMGWEGQHLWWGVVVGVVEEELELQQETVVGEGWKETGNLQNKCKANEALHSD